MNGVAERICEYLNFNMTGIFNDLFHVHCAVSKKEAALIAFERF